MPFLLMLMQVSDAISSLMRRIPRCKGRLLASQAALRAWSKVRPGRAYLPIPWALTLLIAQVLCRSGERMAGCAVVIAHHAFLRVGEMLRLRSAGVVFGAMDRWQQFPREASLRLKATKTGANQHVRITCAGVARLLWEMAKGKAGHDYVVPLSYSQMRTRLVSRGCCCEVMYRRITLGLPQNGELNSQNHPDR